MLIFANNSRSKKNEENLGDVGEVSAKILKFRVAGAPQSFQIFIQITWFLENDRALSKCMGFCMT